MKRPKRSITGELKTDEAVERKVSSVLSEHPDANPEVVRQSFLLLRLSPIKRLERALQLGGAAKRKAQRKKLAARLLKAVGQSSLKRNFASAVSLEK